MRHISLQFISVFHNKTTLVHAMAWCWPSTSHRLDQWWYWNGKMIWRILPMWSHQATLQRRHVKVMASQITVNSIVCWETWRGWQQRKINKSPHYWPLVRRNHWLSMDAQHKGSVLRQAFLYRHIMLVMKKPCAFAYGVHGFLIISHCIYYM